MKRATLSLAAAAILTATPVCLAASFAGVEVPPPPPPKPVTDTHFGVAVSDPYRSFENVKDPAVQAWMKSQADAATAILAKLPGRDPLLARIKEIDAASPGATSGAVRVASGRYFFQKRDPADNQFRLVYRDSEPGPDVLIVDPAELQKKTGTPHAIMDFTPSPDGKRIAYAIQAGGGEIGTLHVVDLASGKELLKPIDRIRYAVVSWLDDGSGFFYSRIREGWDKLPPTERFGDRARHFRTLDKPEADAKVFSPTLNADLKLPIYADGYVMQIAGTRQAASITFFGVERYRALYLADLEGAKTGTARWKRVVALDDKVGDSAIAGGYIYVRSSKGAPRFQVLRMPLASPDLAKAEVIVPASESVIGSIEGASPTVDGVVLQLSGWTRAPKPHAYVPSRGAVAELPFVASGALDAPNDVVAREVRYRSHDGVEIPLSILARKDVKLDGSTPTIVYGYGAYGSTEDPAFNPRIYAWVERGGVFAYAHVRGGGAFGEEWHLAGRKATKPNTWKDAIAAAEWLIANNYTSKSRVGIYGGSAGGILVGRAITERPDLFAAAVPVVGTFDGPRFETSANGVANIPEFGTVKDEGEFKALLAMSTYHSIRDKTAYPGILLVHGVNDIRVDVWQSLKGGARFATATSSGKPVLMRLEYDSGHGQGSTRAQLQARAADMWSFMLWQFGVPDFQPK